MPKLALGKKEIAKKFGKGEEYKSLVNRKYSLNDLKFNGGQLKCVINSGRGIVLLFFKKGKGRMKS